MRKFHGNQSLVPFAVMALALTLAAAGCSKKSGSTGEGGELNKAERLAIGINQNYFPVIVAYEKGFFKDELGDAIKIEIPLFSASPAQNEAFNAGRLDISCSGDLGTVQLWANGTDIQVISYLYDSPDANCLVVNKKSGIKTLADLKGKKIATRFGTAGHKFVLKALASQGLDANDVELVHLQLSESNTALKQGVVDASGFIEPYATQALNEDDNLFRICTSRDYGGLFTVMFVQTEYARKNPKIVSGYLKAIKKANDWIAKNADEATRIVAEFMGTDDLEATKLFLEICTWPVAVDQDLINRLNDAIKFSREQEMITRDDLDAKNIVTDKYIKAAGL